MTMMIKTVSEKKFPIIMSAIAFSLFLVASFLTFVKSPVDQNDTQVTVEIPRGASFTAAVSILSDAGLIKHKALF
jgi:cell division protein YceG involved in septum cleavage